jgi:hypothetical protein
VGWGREREGGKKTSSKLKNNNNNSNVEAHTEVVARVDRAGLARQALHLAHERLGSPNKHAATHMDDTHAQTQAAVHKRCTQRQALQECQRPRARVPSSTAKRSGGLEDGHNCLLADTATRLPTHLHEGPGGIGTHTIIVLQVQHQLHRVAVQAAGTVHGVDEVVGLSNGEDTARGENGTEDAVT